MNFLSSRRLELETAEKSAVIRFNYLLREIDGKADKHNSDDCVPREKLVLTKHFYKRNIEKLKLYLFKQYTICFTSVLLIEKANLPS